MEQQSVIRARQNKWEKISTFYPLVEVTGTVAQLSWSATQLTAMIFLQYVRN